MIKSQLSTDLLRALKLAAGSALGKLVQAWLYVPCGLMVMLTACFGLDVLFKKLGVAFPASVAGLVVLFLGLLAAEAVLGTHKTKRITALVDVSAGWALRWMGVLFTPSFILLPLSPPIGIIEVFKIIAVFIMGFLVMMAMAAYLTRGFQLLFPSSKRAMVQRAEELGRRTPDLPLSEDSDSPEESRATSISAAGSTVPLQPMPPSRSETPPQSPPQLRVQEHLYASDAPPQHVAEALSTPAYPSQTPIPLPRAERWAALMTANLNLAIFASLFVFVGIPVYYVSGYAMPLHVAINILTYFAALAVPLAWQKYLHPVLVCSLFSVLIIWAMAEIKGDSLNVALLEYRTGAKYLQLWENTKLHKMPGAGDVLGTILDASIVSLALPMFQYRRELRSHFLSILVPSVLISIGSLFAYPPVCYAIGITAERSLAFASRSLTLALAIPATENLGGDGNTIAAIAIVSGIIGAVMGLWILAKLRIPEDDYVTRGVTMGVNSSAIATAVLLRTDPRAAALSSLSMSLFGAVTVLFTSIPPMANIVRSLVGL